MNEIVKYHNDLTDLPLRKFNAAELDLLMTICSKCKYQDTAVLKISFDDLEKLANYKADNKKRLADDIRKTNKKLLELNIMLRDAENPGTTVQFALFSRFVTSEEKQTLEVKVNEEFKYILNDLTGNFTRFELEEFVQLKSSYAKACYRQLKRYRDTGFWTVSIEQFRELMDIPKSYRISHINTSVLKPIEEELSTVFKHFTISKDYGSGRGKPVIGLIFHFDPEPKWEPIEPELQSKGFKETGFVCPECGKPLVEKMVNGSNCWCHIDGWKSDAACKRIFNSIAEIEGYLERPKKQKETPDAEPEHIKKSLFGWLKK